MLQKGLPPCASLPKRKMYYEKMPPFSGGGPIELAGSAVAAVRQWKYKPYLLTGTTTPSGPRRRVG